jgi:tRNA 2-thiouridine synthesizing protein C
MPLTYEDEDDDWAEKDSIRVVTRDEMKELMEQQDVLFNF